MAEQVTYTREATECCGSMTKQEALGNLRSDFGDCQVIDFSQDQQLVKSLKTNRSDVFSENDVIGICDNERILIYEVDSDGKVNDIYFSLVGLYDLE